MRLPGPIARAVRRGCGWASVLLVARCCAAQQQQTPVFTLKVYANLVQVPTLVLGHEQTPLPRIDFSRFQVSLDGGKKFAPTRVRLEGDDPLELAILLDVSGPERRLIEGFADAAAKMTAAALHPQDSVSVYAVNCNLVRSLRQAPVTGELVRAAVEAALNAPALKDAVSRRACSNEAPLWGSIVRIVGDLEDSHKRRVLLVVSGGSLPGKLGEPEIHRFAADNSVAIFGLNDGSRIFYGPWPNDVVDPLRSLCESTGGIVMSANKANLEKRLEEWIALLRGRYVVEFPRPLKLATGAHDIQISIKRDDMAFVTLSGVSVSLPDPSLTSDPNYVPSQAGADIPVGTQRPKTH